MPDPLFCSIFLFLAFLMAGIAQTVWLKSRYSRRFAMAIDRGRTFRGHRVFGDNKTWRGFLVMPIAVGIAFITLQAVLPRSDEVLWPLPPLAYFGLGCWVGLAFMLAELPNSFCKRQLGVQPGEAAIAPAARQLCFAIDQVDSILGGMLALAIFVPVPLPTVLCVLLLGPVVHWLFNCLFVILGLKSRAA